MLDTIKSGTPIRTEVSSPRRPTQAGPDFSWTVTAIAAVAWVTFMGISMAVQPPAPDPTAPIALSAVVVGLAFHSALFAAAAGLGTRHRYGLWATLAGGLVMIGAAVLCYWGGHTGTWIAVQLGSGVGLTAIATGLIRVG